MLKTKEDYLKEAARLEKKAAAYRKERMFAEAQVFESNANLCRERAEALSK